MSDNPYSPPDAESLAADRTGSLACTVMFWLSYLLCAVTFFIAVNSVYQYWFYTWHMAIPLPATILAETVCVACSSIGMLYSTIMWRRRLIRRAGVSFVFSLLALFVGPLFI